MLRPLWLACVISAIVAMTPWSGAYAQPELSAYAEIEAGPDGWDAYVGAPMVDRAAAEGLDPPPETPEAAVVKFLASRLRGDDAWQGAVVPNPTDRARRGLAEWDEWQLERFQLRGRSELQAHEVRVRVFFEISVDGDTAEDEFEVTLEGNEWRIVRVPS